MRNKLVYIFIVALIVRVALLIHLGDTLLIDFGQIEALKNMVEGHGFSEKVVSSDGVVNYIPTARDLPGHGLVIIAVWFITGTQSMVPVQVLQVILDSLMIFLIYGIGRRMFSSSIGLLAAALYAIYLPEAYLAVLARRDVWVSFGIISSFYCCLRFIDGRKWSWMLLSSLVLAWTVYFRSTIILYPFALGIGFLRVMSWRRATAASVLMFSIIVLGLLPWGIRNYEVFNGRFLLTELNFYQSMWEGFGQFPNPVGAINNDVLTEKRMREEGYQGRFASFEYEEFLKPKVIQTIRDNPGWYLGTIVQRIPRALVINRVHWGVFQKQGLEYHTFHLRPDAQAGEGLSLTNYALQMMRKNPGFLLTKFLDIMVLVLACYGFWSVRRTASWQSTLLVVIPLYFILTLIPIRIEGRYMVPIHWVYLIFMAIALQKIAERFRRKHTLWV